MKTIYAYQVSGNLYDCTYSDDVVQDRLTWHGMVQTALDCGFERIEINRSNYRGEGEPLRETISVASLRQR